MLDEAGILCSGAYLGSGDGEGGAIGVPLFASQNRLLLPRVASKKMKQLLVWTPIYYFTENVLGVIEIYCPS